MRDSDLLPGADQPGLVGGLTTPALKSLVVDGLRLVPQFSATVSSYAATAESDVERLTLLATTADSRSSMSISHADADPDTDGHQVDFAVGVTVITFSILAEDGVSAKTYTCRPSRRWSPGATGRPRRTRSGTSKTVDSSRGRSACAAPSPRASASSSTREAVLGSWRPAQEAWTSPPCTPCARASSCPTSSVRRPS